MTTESRLVTAHPPMVPAHRIRQIDRCSGLCALPRLIAALVFVSASTGVASSSPSREERIAAYVQYCAAVRELMIDGGRSPHHAAPLATSLDLDPSGLATWVREKIAYDPSVGSNRGSEGTLAAMAGGDWDRALLLGEMLRAGGYSPRYVVVRRTPTEIATLQSDWLARPSPWRGISASAPRPAGAAVAEVLVDHGVNLASVRSRHERSAQLWEIMLNESTQPVDAVAKKIESTVSGLARPTEAAAGSERRLQQTLSARVLVEIDVDGKLLILSPGPEPAVPSSTLVAALPRLEEVPEDQRTQFTVTVQMEPEGGPSAVEPISVFTWTKDLSTLGLNSARLEIVPVGVTYDEPAYTWSPAVWHERLKKLNQFQVILRHGESVLASSAFTRDGTLLDKGGQDQDAGQMGKGLGGLFGDALGGEVEESTPAKKTPPPTVAPGLPHSLSLVLEVREPGQPVIRQKRLLTGALRPGKLPIYTADILASGGALGPWSVAWLALDTTTANAAPLGEVLASSDPKRFEGRDDLKRFPALLFDWQLGRLALAARLLRDHPDLTLRTGPTVVLVSSQVYPGEGTTGVGARVALDVVCDGLTLVPRTKAALPTMYAANLRLGIGSTLLETALLSRRLPPPAPQGTFEAWKLADRAGLRPQAMLATSLGAAGSVLPHPLARWGIEAGESGRLLVFPGGSEPRVWWSIDPIDGRAIGRGDGAEGQSAMEYLQVLKMNLSNLKCNLTLMHAMLGGGDNNTMARDWAMCITGSDNPGSYLNWTGSMVEVYGIADPGLAKMGDCLAGAVDLIDLIKGD